MGATSGNKLDQRCCYGSLSDVSIISKRGKFMTSKTSAFALAACLCAVPALADHDPLEPLTQVTLNQNEAVDLTTLTQDSLNPSVETISITEPTVVEVVRR